MNPADWLMDVIEGTKINPKLDRVMTVEEIADRWRAGGRVLPLQHDGYAEEGFMGGTSGEVPEVGLQSHVMQLQTQVTVRMTCVYIHGVCACT